MVFSAFLCGVWHKEGSEKDGKRTMSLEGQPLLYRFLLVHCVAKALSCSMTVLVCYSEVATNGVQADRTVYFENFKRLCRVSKSDIIGIRVSDGIRFRYLLI